MRLEREGREATLDKPREGDGRAGPRESDRAESGEGGINDGEGRTDVADEAGAGCKCGAPTFMNSEGGTGTALVPPAPPNPKRGETTRCQERAKDEKGVYGEL